VRRKLRVTILAVGLVAASLAVIPAMAATHAAGPTAAQLQAKANACTTVVSKNGGYKTDTDKGAPGGIQIRHCGLAYVWTADMDVDCDGLKTAHCNHQADPWYQGQTSFNATNTKKSFRAEFTHYYVIPLPSNRWNYMNAGIKPGTVAAVLYQGKMVYATFADEGPNNIIGEASWLTNKDLGVNPDPANGGTDGPVTYIVLTGYTSLTDKDNAKIDAQGAAGAQKWVNS
jgi:hypothetical protein